MSTHFYIKIMEKEEKREKILRQGIRKVAFVCFFLKMAGLRIIVTEFWNTYFDVFVGGKKHL